jgi:hypothetical protein
MGFGGFVRKNLGPSALWAGGFLVGAWGFLADARDLWTAGVKPEYLQLSGFVVFVISTIAVVYRQHQHLEDRLGGLTGPNVIVRAPSAGPISAPISTQAVVQELPTRKEDRTYLPRRFVDQYVKLVSERATDLQIESILGAETGKWMKLSGALWNIGMRGDDFCAQVVMPESNQSVFVVFRKYWSSQLAHLKIGETFAFDACIGDDLPYLSDGELI